MRAPRLYLGTMTFGWSSQTSSIVDTEVANQMVSAFVRQQQQQQQNQGNAVVNNDHNNKTGGVGLYSYHIDTARIYSNGQCEVIVGDVLKRRRQEHLNNELFAIGTKAAPSQPNGLSRLGLQQQIDTSISALGLDRNIDNNDDDTTRPVFAEYYLHQPDPNNPLLDSIQCLNDYCTKGIIHKIGMSNYHVKEMEHVYELCKHHKIQHKPLVYQGLYNPLNRLVEDELIPLLRQNNCSFIAYNPLAGGLLVDGKHVQLDNTDNNKMDDNKKLSTPSTIQKGRFFNNPNYIPRFYTEHNFHAVQIIQKACNDVGITMIDATYRWLLYHSILNSKYGDGILLGASSIEQLEQNLQYCTTVTSNDSNSDSAVAASTLPDTVVQAFDDAWDITRQYAFPYWRSYSADMPNRDSLHPGASYDATKKQ